MKETLISFKYTKGKYHGYLGSWSKEPHVVFKHRRIVGNNHEHWCNTSYWLGSIRDFKKILPKILESYDKVACIPKYLR